MKRMNKNIFIWVGSIFVFPGVLKAAIGLDVLVLFNKRLEKVLWVLIWWSWAFIILIPMAIGVRFNTWPYLLLFRFFFVYFLVVFRQQFRDGKLTFLGLESFACLIIVVGGLKLYRKGISILMLFFVLCAKDWVLHIVESVLNWGFLLSLNKYLLAVSLVTFIMFLVGEVGIGMILVTEGGFWVVESLWIAKASIILAFDHKVFL